MRVGLDEGIETILLVEGIVEASSNYAHRVYLPAPLLEKILLIEGTVEASSSYGHRVYLPAPLIGKILLFEDTVEASWNNGHRVYLATTTTIKQQINSNWISMVC